MTDVGACAQRRGHDRASVAGQPRRSEALGKILQAKRPPYGYNKKIPEQGGIEEPSIRYIYLTLDVKDDSLIGGGCDQPFR